MAWYPGNSQLQEIHTTGLHLATLIYRTPSTGFMSGLTNTTQTHPQNPPTTQRTLCFSGDPYTGSERSETGEPPQSAGRHSVARRVLVQHHQASKADYLTCRPESTDTHLQLDPGFPHKQTTGGKAGKEGLCRVDGEHRNAAGLLPRPKTLLTIHT